MRRYLFVLAVFIFSISMFGCGKKEETLEQIGEPISMEALSTTATTTAPTAGEVKAPLQAGAPTEAVLPPAGPYKPSVIEIQTALKNANFYAGEIDGKIGSKTKKAVEEFQKANNLKVDGKVGSKTWEVLSSYLSAGAGAAPTKKTKKKR